MLKLPSMLFAALFVLLCRCPVFSQNLQKARSPEPAIDLSTAHRLLAAADTAYEANRYRKAAIYAQPAYLFLHLSPNQHPGMLADAAFQWGRALSQVGQPDSAKALLLEARERCQVLAPEGSLEEAKVLISSAELWFRIGHADSAAVSATNALELQEKLLPTNDTTCAKSQILLGRIYHSQGLEDKALPLMEQALAVFLEQFGEKSRQYGVLLRDIGEIQVYLYDYDKSLSNLEKALSILQGVLPPNDPEIVKTWITLGERNRHLGKNEVALDYLHQALAVLEKNPERNNRLIVFCCSELGQAYINKKDNVNALHYFLKEDSVMVQMKWDSSQTYAYSCHDLGKLNYYLHHFPEAIRWQQKALELFQMGSTEESSDIGSLYLWLGRAQLANSDFQDAINSFNHDYRIIVHLFGPDNSQLRHAEGDLGNAYLKWYQKTKDQELLLKSRQYFKTAKERIESLLLTKTLYSEKTKILSESIDVFEQAIQVELLFYTNTKDATTLENAWELSELMHGFLLNAATQEADARHFAGIPDELLRQDSLLRNDITQLGEQRNDLIEYYNHLLTDSIILALDLQLSDKRATVLQLQQQFEKKYPEFFRLKYDLQTTTLKQTQQMLQPGQTLLEYFSGDSTIIIFVLKKGDTQVVQVPRDFPLSEWVTKFREGISAYHTASEQTSALYQQTVQQYAEFAQKLYKKLLVPVAQYLSPELIIIPGDGFYNLPFEALLTGLPKDLSNFNTYPFVVRQYSINYAYSATMLQQMTAKKHRQAPKSDLLAFAPFYEPSSNSGVAQQTNETAKRLGFSPLRYSGEEVSLVQKHFSGKSTVLTGSIATKEQFLDMAGNFQVLHLATHGKANHQEGQFSFLAFADDKNREHSLLSVGELYNCSLNADLVVLSACETGIGEEQRGEGMVSLARAFAFAGAKSIVSTLWSVNDKSTMQVMDDFYTELKAGKTKNNALEAAKIHYLGQNPGLLSHPFFWAGFVAVGDLTGMKN